ncbi:hypothetical protein [Pantoea endophytica]
MVKDEAYIEGSEMIIKRNVSKTFYNDSFPAERFYIGSAFSGMDVSSEKHKVIPFRIDGSYIFTVVCKA